MKNYTKDIFRKSQFWLGFALLFISYLWYAKITGVLLGINKFEMFFFDSDDYMMLTRIRDFFHFGTTSYSLINRVNVPYGADLYWTHLYDSILISLSWLVSWFSSSMDRAVELTGFFIAPIFRFLIALLLLKIFSKISPKIAFITAILFILHFSLCEIFALGRPDHHAFIMFLEVYFLYYLKKFIFNCSLKNSITLALLTSLCIWSSTETLPLLLICEVVLFFFGTEFTPAILFKKNLLIAIFISLILLSKSPADCFTTFLLISVYLISNNSKYNKIYFTFPALILIFYFSLTTNIIYDEISKLHLNLYLTACIYFEIMNLFKGNKLKIGIPLGLILGGIFLFFYPNFLLGIEGNASKFLRDFWFPTIIDLSSIFRLDHIIFGIIFWFNTSVLFIAAYDKLITINSFKNIGKDEIFWLILVVLSVSYSVFAVFACRMILTFYVLSLPIVVEFCLSRFKRNFGIKLSFTFIIIPSLSYLLITPRGDWFDWRGLSLLRLYNENKVEFFKSLNTISEKPKVIMADPYSGPEILYFSKHNVVSVPFHRQEKGLISSLIITQWKEFNEKLSINELIKTNSSYILIRRANGSLNNLEGVIANSYIPKWISLSLIDKNKEFRLVKIDTDLMKKNLESEK